MEKKKHDSWVDETKGNESFLGRKIVDKSTFKYGTMIPLRFHKVILDNLSDMLTVGKSIKVKVVVNNKSVSRNSLLSQ
ncbi:hypothetical protein [Clostridium estertheticum]|uniref:hypothetical protein n=1 Tax=Clostridium estertheticum TaxID=238834 RepID=UPI001CF43EE4|nr:hypothetical protein [Clostridium estertheticum]MCB2358669.1 hypothetical protein [Clostridium estertheticum]